MSGREWPLIFTSHSIRAIREGRKTQTRRVLTRTNTRVDGRRTSSDVWSALDLEAAEITGPAALLAPHRIAGTIHRITPAWEAGDRIWVKEAFAGGHGAPIVYREATGEAEGVTWKSPLFMPRDAARIVLEVVGVRVERIAEIGEEDARDEGAPAPHLETFRAVWNELNAARGFGWETNPLVVAVEYRVNS